VCVWWFITTICTSVSNLLCLLDAGRYEVRVLSLTCLLAIAHMCSGSSPLLHEFQIFFPCWMLVGTRFESSLSSMLAIACVLWFITTICTSLSNLLPCRMCVDAVQVLSLSSLWAITRVCDGSSPPFVFQIFILCWMPVGTRFESLSHFFVGGYCI
jgi:hypothetical protein